MLYLLPGLLRTCLLATLTRREQLVLLALQSAFPGRTGLCAGTRIFIRSAHIGFDQGTGAAGDAERGGDILTGFCGWKIKTSSSDFEMVRSFLKIKPGRDQGMCSFMPWKQRSSRLGEGYEVLCAVNRFSLWTLILRLFYSLIWTNPMIKGILIG